MTGFGRIPRGMIALTMPEQRYVVFQHKGPMSQVQQTYENAFVWLKANGHQIDPEGTRFARGSNRVEGRVARPPSHTT